MRVLSAADAAEVLARAGLSAGRWVRDPGQAERQCNPWDKAATRAIADTYLDAPSRRSRGRRISN
jgi:hypothetical protein